MSSAYISHLVISDSISYQSCDISSRMLELEEGTQTSLETPL
jgi:hypothetical protein